MRLPYIPDDLKMETAEDQAVVERVKERRGGKLIALDKALLHAPPVADGWNGFLKAIRISDDTASIDQGACNLTRCSFESCLV